MIVFRQPTREFRWRDISSLTNGRDLLIHFGELEAAVIDVGCEAYLQAHYQAISLAAAKQLISPVSGGIAYLHDLLKAAPAPVKPLRIRIPEGYAYYGLYPERYAQAAALFWAAKRPESVICVGIRSIGTSLNAVVAAALEARGCRTYCSTVRPEGHPFDRRVQLEPDLKAAWHRMPGAHFAIVDEGPGLSGTSFAATAEAISGLGVADHRISLLPHVYPRPEQFNSERARRRWMRHDVFPAESGLCWRADEEPGTARKFAGLGLYGQTKMDIALQLARSGFGPEVIGLEDGYLSIRCIDGDPAQPGSVNQDLLDTIASYLAMRAASFVCSDFTPSIELSEMICTNLHRDIAPLTPERPCFTDGRMQPENWIMTRKGYRKIDALDHGNSHFYPGPTDIAWDLAGAIVEFQLDREARSYLLSKYKRIANDRGIFDRLPFYSAAYLAFRAGSMSFRQ